MKKYEPKYINDEIAIQGWESAALFVQGVKMAGNNLTQANVVKTDQHHHVVHRRRPHRPDELEDGRPLRPRAAVLPAPTSRRRAPKYVPALNKGKNVFVCFQSANPNKAPVYPVPAGTPAPA